MNLANFGAVRRLLLVSAVLTLSPLVASAQIVERSQTWANLIATHPCNAGLNGRHTILTDAQSSSSIGGGGGSVRVFVECDGVDTWSIVSIGGGASGPADALAPAVVIEGTTADAFEGNFTFADPTADWTWAWGADGTLTGATQFNLENLRLDGNTISTTDTNGNINLTPNGTGQVVFPHGSLAKPGLAANDNHATGFHVVSGGTESLNYVINGTPVLFASAVRLRLPGAAQFGWISSTDTNANELDTLFQRSAAGIVKLTNTLNLVPIASPPRTCDATAEGDIYSDTSHALCWCDASSWQKLSGAGTCA